jgi:hypothetical protein
LPGNAPAEEIVDAITVSGTASGKTGRAAGILPDEIPSTAYFQ